MLLVSLSLTTQGATQIYNQDYNPISYFEATAVGSLVGGLVSKTGVLSYLPGVGHLSAILGNGVICGMTYGGIVGGGLGLIVRNQQDAHQIKQLQGKLNRYEEISLIAAAEDRTGDHIQRLKAMKDLATLYGTEGNATKARYWHVRAAIKGDLDSLQHLISSCYGENVFSYLAQQLSKNKLSAGRVKLRGREAPATVLRGQGSDPFRQITALGDKRYTVEEAIRILVNIAIGNCEMLSDSNTSENSIRSERSTSSSSEKSENSSEIIGLPETPENVFSHFQATGEICGTDSWEKEDWKIFADLSSNLEFQSSLSPEKKAELDATIRVGLTTSKSSPVVKHASSTGEIFDNITKSPIILSDSSNDLRNVKDWVESLPLVPQSV